MKTKCELCGQKLRTYVERETQLCEECERREAEYYENC